MLSVSAEKGEMRMMLFDFDVAVAPFVTDASFLIWKE